MTTTTRPAVFDDPARIARVASIFRAALARQQETTYRLLVTGSREWDDKETLVDALYEAWLTTPGVFVLVHGACPTGADAMAQAWGEEMGAAHVRIEQHPADWQEHGKPAGMIRNAQMVDRGADQCFAFFKDGAANDGTTHCTDLAEKAGIPVTRWYA
jgi:hypothetical protein